MTEADKINLIRDYQERKTAGKLSLNLSNSSPGKLKAECRLIYEQRGMPKIDDTLRLFFETNGDSNGYTSAIKEVDIDKFRPLNNLLKGRTDNPQEKHYKMLAWLMHYQPADKESVNISPENEDFTHTGLDQTVEKGDDENGPVAVMPFVSYTKVSTQKKPAKLIAIPQVLRAMAAIVLAGIGIFIYLEVRGCMYWKGDHYEKSSCTVKLAGTPLIAFNEEKASHLKKITRPDTLNYTSIGRVWYVKIGKGIEFYSSEGFHPIETKKRLKPITKYIIDKYILPMKQGKNKLPS